MTDVREAPVSAARTDPNPAGDYIWYELITPDPEGAKRFYDSVVGWNIGEGAAEYQGYRMINTADGGMAGGVLPLTPEMQQHGARPTWLGYIFVADVDQAVASIEGAGGKALMPATDIPGVGRIAMVADPQGAPFYVMKPIPPEGRENEPSDVFSPDKVGRCGWNELATRDPNGALDFYTSQFGWTKGDTMPLGDIGDYQFITHHGLMLGAIMTAAPDRPTRWRFYFRVANVDDAKGAVEAGGGTVLHGPQEVPGGDRILIGTDPQGAEFALVGK